VLGPAGADSRPGRTGSVLGVKIGELELVVVNDGEGKLPSSYIPAADWDSHKDYLDDEGNFDIALGCFLVRTGNLTVLIDAGLGPVTFPPFRGGDLPANLARNGVKPEDVDLVLLTHLHIDHIGWTVQNDEVYFPNATIRFGAQDLDQFVRTKEPDGFTAPVIQVLESKGKVDPISSDGEVAPGISTVHSPGHTLGHRHVVISSGDQRALLLGDAVACPIQLEDSDWSAMSDIDPKLSARSREALYRELEGTNDVAAPSHFPGLEFGRVLRGQGKRYFG
jgi:glyoxylase-like metal-dependent hydrolase (beta-lactamase superfamily II)